MERDMGTTIATKSDLQLLRQELTFSMSALATREEVLALKADVGEIRQECALIRKDMEILATTMTVRPPGLSCASSGCWTGATLLESPEARRAMSQAPLTGRPARHVGLA